MARIVIALGPGTASSGGIELVRHLSRDPGAELLGLLIEDVSVLEHARSHLAREVLLSGLERPLEEKLLEKQIRAQLAGVRARFENLARQLGLRHGFHVMRGEMISELIKGAAGAHTLVVDVQTIHQHVSFSASVARLVAVETPALLFAKERWSSGAGILAVVEDEASAEAVLAAALPLGASMNSPVTVLVPGADPDAETDAEIALHAKIAAIYSASGQKLDPVVTGNPALAADVARAARNAHAGLLVMQRGPRREEAALVAELLEKTPSSLLLVN